MRKPLSSVFLSFIIMLAFVGLVTLVILGPSIELSQLVFGRHTIYVHRNMPIRVDLADTPLKQKVGLSNKSVMAAGEGMLFVFDRDDKWRVWMKGMHFGLDILWLDDNGKIIDMREYVYPDSYPNVFAPKYPAKYILEVIAGYASAIGLRKGDIVDVNL